MYYNERMIVEEIKRGKGREEREGEGENGRRGRRGKEREKGGSKKGGEGRKRKEVSKPCIPTTTVREWRAYGAAMKSAGPTKQYPIPQMKNPVITNPLGPWRTEYCCKLRQ